VNLFEKNPLTKSIKYSVKRGSQDKHDIFTATNGKSVFVYLRNKEVGLII